MLFKVCLGLGLALLKRVLKNCSFAGAQAWLKTANVILCEGERWRCRKKQNNEIQCNRSRGGNLDEANPYSIGTPSLVFTPQGNCPVRPPFFYPYEAEELRCRPLSP